MNEPQLPEDILALLEHERERPNVPDAALAHAEARIEAAIAGSQTATDAPQPTTPAAESASLLAKIVSKPLLSGIVLFALGGAGGAAIHAQLAPARVVYVDKVIVAAHETPPTSTSTKSDSPATISSTSLPIGSSSAPVPPTSAMSRAQSLALERLVLEEARTALARGDGVSALTALDRHAMKFPRGALGEEREAMAVQALASIGRTAEARARAARFHKFFPSSMLSPMVDAAAGENK